MGKIVNLPVPDFTVLFENSAHLYYCEEGAFLGPQLILHLIKGSTEVFVWATSCNLI